MLDYASFLITEISGQEIGLQMIASEVVSKDCGRKIRGWLIGGQRECKDLGYSHNSLRSCCHTFINILH